MALSGNSELNEDELADENDTFVSEDELLVAESPEKWKDLLCIEYPGIVENDEKALETLGGMDVISKSCLEQGYNRLELRFRPDDIYCKPAIGRSSKTCCLALKIKRKKDQPESMSIEHDEVEEYKYSAEILGLVDTIFEFSGMADFQVLPPGVNSLDYKGIPVDQTTFQMTDLLDESSLSNDVPEFLPPSIFSKLDRPATYSFKPDTKHNIGTHSEKPVQQLPGRSRARRANYAHAVSFTHTGDIPSEPLPSLPLSNHPKLNLLKELFEERPVWSRSAIQAKLKLSNSMCRLLLPVVGYNFTNGPWRTLWVKYRYDPRASPEGKRYQCLDFRVPRSLETKVIAPSRGYQQRMARPLGVGGESESRRQREMTREEESMRLAQERLSSTVDETIDETAYIFDPNYLPQQRQQFYQLCDLHDDSLQAIIHNNDGKETKCHEVTGWCDEDSYEKLRKRIIELIVAKAVKEGIIGKQGQSQETEDKL